MKKRSVYPFFLILLGFSLLFATGCSRKSGCAVLDQTTKPAKKQRGKNSNMFGHH